MSDSISVLIFVESRYKVNRKKIKNAVLEELKKGGITPPAEVSVAIVGDRKMRSLNKKYRNLDKTTNILSFSLTEGEASVLPPSTIETLRLGDIVLSYPEVIREASADDVMVDDKVDELIRHGLAHLLGVHHN